MGLDITAELLTQHPRARAAFRSCVQTACFANGTMRPRAGTAVPSIQVLEEPRLLPKSPNSQRGAPSKVGQDQKAVGPGQLTRHRGTGLWRVRINLDNVLKSVFPNGLMFSQMKSCAFSEEETSTVSKEVWCFPARVWSRKEKASVHLCVRVCRCWTHLCLPSPKKPEAKFLVSGGKSRMAYLKRMGGGYSLPSWAPGCGDPARTSHALWGLVCHTTSSPFVIFPTFPYDVTYRELIEHMSFMFQGNF